MAPARRHLLDDRGQLREFRAPQRLLRRAGRGVAELGEHLLDLLAVHEARLGPDAVERHVGGHAHQIAQRVLHGLARVLRLGGAGLQPQPGVLQRIAREVGTAELQREPALEVVVAAHQVVAQHAEAGAAHRAAPTRASQCQPPPSARGAISIT